jgi:glycosyltransferase involved in cell wall biosynthesis
MKTEILLSVLTPAMPSRMAAIAGLCAEMHVQIGEKAAEHLVLLDNKRRTVGEKRDALLRAARGRFVAFVDDDDWVSPDYIRSLLMAADESPGPDVVTFLQEADIEGRIGRIEFRLGNPNEPFVPGGTARRNAWHVCAWRRELAILSHFPAVNYGEDWAFAEPLCRMAGLKEVHVPRILHRYIHSAKGTLAPAGS